MRRPCRRADRSSGPPRRGVQAHRRGTRIARWIPAHRDAVAGAAARGIGRPGRSPVLEMLVQVIDILHDPILQRACHGDVVEDRQVLDILAEPDASCVGVATRMPSGSRARVTRAWPRTSSGFVDSSIHQGRDGARSCIQSIASSTCQAWFASTMRIPVSADLLRPDDPDPAHVGRSVGTHLDLEMSPSGSHAFAAQATDLFVGVPEPSSGVRAVRRIGRGDPDVECDDLSDRDGHGWWLPTVRMRGCRGARRRRSSGTP